MSLFTEVLLFDIFSVITALLVIGYVYFKWTYQYWAKRNVPYLEPSVPYGNLKAPHRRVISIGDEIAQLYKLAKSKGWEHFGIFTMASPTYIPMNLDLVKCVMTKDFSHFVDRGVYTNEKNEPISAHLFAIGGAKWRNLRTKLTPTFTSGKMKTMFQTLVDCGLVLEKYMEEEIENNTPVDIKSVLACFSTDIIGSCAFGLEINSFKEPDSPFRQFGLKIFTRSNLGLLKFSFAFNFPKVARALGICLTPPDVRSFFTKVVEDTVSYREKNKIVRNDFLQMLIDIRDNGEMQEKEHNADGKSLTMKEIVAQSFVFFVAGFETSSTTMTFALFELATHPHIQEKVREEIKTVLKKYDNKMTYDSLSELKYMKQVIDETLRKYPPVPFITRVCVEDYKVPNSDVIIEKGTKVIIPVQGIQYDEDYYPNPQIFDPERFSDENVNKRHQYSHLPFGEGPRICIGMRFGIMQTKVGLTSLLRNFKVKLNGKTKVPLKMSIHSFISSTEGGVWLDFEKLVK